MSFNDPIAQFLTEIRNAKNAKHLFIDINMSRMRIGIAKILQERGVISKFLLDEKKKKIRIFLKYYKNRRCQITNLKRISKPGCRKYVGYKNIPKVLGGFGFSILSTSKGILDDRTAKEMKVGGEVLCYIW